MPTPEEEYKFDAFDDGSHKFVSEVQLQKLKDQVKTYSAQLSEIEEALNDTVSEVWDFNNDPIRLNLEPYEQTNLLELTKTDNKLYNKLMLTFGSLCQECKHLKSIAQEKFYPAFMMFASFGDPGEGEAQEQIGRMLPLFLDMINFVNRVYSVVQNIVCQLSSLYSPTQKLYGNFKSVHLSTVYEHLGELFVVLITLDEIIIQNTLFNQAWAMYKRMTRTMRQEPESYQLDEDKLLQFEKLLLSIEGQLFEGFLYRNCIEQEFDFPGVMEVRQNALFQQEFFLNVKALFNRLESKITDWYDTYSQTYCVTLYALFTCQYAIFKKPPEKKFFKSLWSLSKHLPVVPLCGNVHWFITDFLQRLTPMMVKTLGSTPNVVAERKEYLKQLDRSFADTVQSLYLQTSAWMVKIESNLSSRAELKDVLRLRGALVLQGLSLAQQISNLCKSFVLLHTHLRAPLRPMDVFAMRNCLEMIKAIQATFHRRSQTMGESLVYVLQQLSYSLQRLLLPIKTKLTAGKKYNEAKLDALAAITLALNVLNGPATVDRRLLLKLSLHVIYQLDFLKETEIEEMRTHVRRIERICELEGLLQEACDCTFLFWNRELIPVFLTQFFNSPSQVHRFQYVCHAISDIIPLFEKCVQTDPTAYAEEYKKQIFMWIKEKIMEPLSVEIENDLRFHIHSQYNPNQRNPFKDGLRDLSRFIKLRPVRLFNQLVDFRASVGHYLDQTFYNLTTVAMHDGQTYAEMRSLAQEKYGLDLTEVHLPGSTLEQGLDVLVIMRNINVFVSRYNYNLNNQIFIEVNSDSKYLSTINIRHIANSICTHGTGIMNTTVNYTYRFLKQKFVIFSQFLFDDHIKARLYKDIRYYREAKDTLDNKYPYDRADKFNREIKKLGVTDGMSYLDQFRILITHIGNAMGYIRMIRSGGMLYTSNAIKFVPDLQNVPTFCQLISNENLSPETIAAGRNLDQAINDLATKFSEGTEYFQMLVNVFAPEFRNTSNQHLKYFYIILPPLMINFVDHSLLAKDKLMKKSPKNSFFSDDGFAIGVAYILKLLDQNKDFDSLHWFESVTQKFEEDKKKLQEMSKIKDNKEEKQSTVLTMKKVSSYLTEFQLLMFSFSGARIFFRE